VVKGTADDGAEEVNALVDNVSEMEGSVPYKKVSSGGGRTRRAPSRYKLL